MDCGSIISLLCLQPGLVNQMMSAAEERPWLWVVYVLTVALPVILIFVFCCTGKVCMRMRGHLPQCLFVSLRVCPFVSLCPSLTCVLSECLHVCNAYVAV